MLSSRSDVPLLDPTRLGKADVEFIVLGESRVGKSTTVAALNDRHYRNIESTIGVEFTSRTFTTRETGDDLLPKQIHIKVWDTAGQERYRSLIQGYFINKAAAIIMFDVTNRHSFVECKHWLSQLKRKTNNPQIVISLVANKTEAKMKAFRVVSREEAQAFADEHGLHYYEVSAIQNEGIADMFQETVARVLKVLDLHPRKWVRQPERHRGLILHPEVDTPKSEWCCKVM